MATFKLVLDVALPLSRRITAANTAMMKCSRKISTSHIQLSGGEYGSNSNSSSDDFMRTEKRRASESRDADWRISVPHKRPFDPDSPARVHEAQQRRASHQYYDISEVLFVGNTPLGVVSDDMLHSLFGPFGKIKHIARYGRLGNESLIYFAPKPDGRPRAVVDSVKAASQTEPFQIKGRRLHVAPATHSDARRLREDVVAVLNCPHDTTSAKVRNFLRKRGAVAAHLQRTMSRCFVRLNSPEAAQELVRLAEEGKVVMNGVTLDITQDNSRVFTHRSRGLFVRDLPFSGDEKSKEAISRQLHDEFSRFGTIEKVAIVGNIMGEAGARKALIVFANEASAHLALNSERITIRGESVRVQLAPMWMAYRFSGYIPQELSRQHTGLDDSLSAVETVVNPRGRASEELGTGPELPLSGGCVGVFPALHVQATENGASTMASAGVEVVLQSEFLRMGVEVQRVTALDLRSCNPAFEGWLVEVATMKEAQAVLDKAEAEPPDRLPFRVWPPAAPLMKALQKAGFEFLAQKESSERREKHATAEAEKLEIERQAQKICENTWRGVNPGGTDEEFLGYWKNLKTDRKQSYISLTDEAVR